MSTDPTPGPPSEATSAYPMWHQPMELPEAGRVPLAYQRLHLAGNGGLARSIIGVLLLGGLVFMVMPIVVLIPFAAWLAVTGQLTMDGLSALLDTKDVTPAGLAYLNISLGAAIPAVWFLTWGVHGLKPGWTTSVRPRMRWRYFAACLGLSIVALGASLLVSVMVPAGTESMEVGGKLNDFTATTRDFLLVVLLLTPFQAAGEEYAFRGYLTQAFGGMFAKNLRVSQAMAVCLPALLFGLAHGTAQGLPVFFDRFAFGVVAGILVILTGGLEAGIAMHVLNNFTAFGLALAFGDMSSTLNPTGGTWWMIPATLTQSLIYLGLAWFVAKRMGLRATSDPAVLAASRGLVYRDPSAL